MKIYWKSAISCEFYSNFLHLSNFGKNSTENFDKSAILKINLSNFTFSVYFDEFFFQISHFLSQFFEYFDFFYRFLAKLTEFFCQNLILLRLIRLNFFFFVNFCHKLTSKIPNFSQNLQFFPLISTSINPTSPPSSRTKNNTNI